MVHFKLALIALGMFVTILYSQSWSCFGVNQIQIMNILEACLTPTLSEETRLQQTILVQTHL